MWLWLVESKSGRLVEDEDETVRKEGRRLAKACVFRVLVRLKLKSMEKNINVFVVAS